MAAEAVLAIIIVIFIAGVITGGVLLVSLASRREDRRRLSREAPSRLTQAGRYVTGLRVGGPDSYRARRRYPDDSQAEDSDLPFRDREPRVR
jgi:hypothetical protein